MKIGKLNNNFKDEKLKCFNYQTYRYIVRDCKKPKKKILENIISVEESNILLETTE